jgi:hypothetical protein
MRDEVRDIFNGLASGALFKLGQLNFGRGSPC